MSNVTMADLVNGTRVRHLRWQVTGTVREVAGIKEIRWDGSIVSDEISDDGLVLPMDVEIIGAAS